MPDFWRASGWHLLDRTAENRLVVTDALLRAYLRRPEMRPPEEACDAERALHEALIADPRRAVDDPTLSRLADPDAADNWRVWLAFRDRLTRAATLEEAYLAIFRDARHGVPPLFLDQLAHMLVRHVLDGSDDAFRARAAELFFRPQTVSLEDGAVLLADGETVEMHAATGGFGDLGRLLVEAQAPLRRIELDILTDENAAAYWRRDERHDMVLDLSFTRPGLDALCRVLEAWVAHMLGVAVAIQPVRQIRDERWSWHVGLDAESSTLLNALYRGEEPGEDRLARLLSLFRLDFADPAAMRADLAGKPVYLGVAMDERRKLRLKPQNLLVNLPLARPT